MLFATLLGHSLESALVAFKRKSLTKFAIIHSMIIFELLSMF